jgi:hypothetical protein
VLVRGWRGHQTKFPDGGCGKKHRPPERIIEDEDEDEDEEEQLSVPSCDVHRPGPAGSAQKVYLTASEIRLRVYSRPLA